MGKKKHNCKKHLTLISENYGIKVEYGIKVIGFKFACKICGKEYGQIVEEDHPFIPSFYV